MDINGYIYIMDINGDMFTKLDGWGIQHQFCWIGLQ